MPATLRRTAAMRIAHAPTTYRAPWVRVGPVVHHDLQWVAPQRNEIEKVTLERALLEGATIREALELDRLLSSRRLDPLAITAFTVEVELAGRSREYRAAAYVYPPAPAPGELTFELIDRVVQDFEHAVPGEALIVTEQQLQEMASASRRP